MKKWLATIVASSFLMACGGNLRTAEPVRYDFGVLAGNGPEPRFPLAGVEVLAASWLSAPDMHFRLGYAEPLRRRTYAESRWAAPPRELLETFLKRRLASGRTHADGTGCRLHVALDELEQRFDDAQNSRFALEVRARLSPVRGSETLARRVFVISRPAGSPDARGGAMAARETVQALADEIVGWLGDVTREKPAIIERCRL